SRDVVIARERISLQIFHAIFDPLNRLAGEDRGCDGDYVAWVYGDLAAESAADVRRYNLNLFLRKTNMSRHQRENSADGMWRLSCHPDRQFAFNFVEMRDAATSLD